MLSYRSTVTSTGIMGIVKYFYNKDIRITKTTDINIISSTTFEEVLR